MHPVETLGAPPARSSACQPIDSLHRFSDPGWHVWCGSVQALPEGGYTLFYSRWPVARGFDAWVDRSEIARAEGPTPWGPFAHVETVFTREENSPAWDAHNFHNVTVRAYGGRYYLYYTGNYGDGEWWDHRNHQRIGVASADSLRGPWKRLPRPIIDVSAGSWDDLCVANPSITDTTDGRYLMVYKGVSDGPRPFGSRVLHGMAFAQKPDGPFAKTGEPCFQIPGVKFAFEDPFLWREGARYRCLMKDMNGVPGSRKCATLLFESDDGVNWAPDRFRLVATPHLRHAASDGTANVEEVERLERPSYFRDRNFACLSFAVKTVSAEPSFLVFKPGVL
ncbi:MAG: glycoside hydrolase family protein [Burkholderiales bacterium]|nr:glycoside hydrolase family protein [Opitutaceae bacterium]